MHLIAPQKMTDQHAPEDIREAYKVTTSDLLRMLYKFSY